MSSRNRFFTVLAVALACAGLSRSAAEWPEGKPASRLVDKSPNGLEYTGFVNIGETNEVNTLIDYSAVGYKKGGVPIPFIPAKVIITDDGPSDDTARIQTAINQVSALPVGPDGFRGALLIKAGEYTVSDTLTVSESGVVIRGEGQQAAGGTTITYTKAQQSNLFSVYKSAGLSAVGPTVAVTDDMVPVGAKSFHVSDGSSFSPGDVIKIDYKINDTWIADKGVIYWGADAFQLGFIRTIEAVNGNQITLVEPLVEAVQMKYGGAVIQKRNDDNVFKHVGFEALRLVSDYAHDTDDNHGWTAIRMQNLHDGWVRQVTAQYFAYSLVTFDDSRQATVEDCAFINPKSLIAGGHRYSFGLDDTQQILFQRCLAHEGRHDFVSGSKAPGPNAWVDCSTVNSLADSGPHLKYGTGQIYDNVKAKQFTVHQTGGTHGWTGAQILFWNSQAADTVPADIEAGGFITCDASVGAMNWCIGSVGIEYHRKTVQDRGIWDSHGTPVRIRSLYYAQLEERLGMNAVNNIILSQQKAGRIWNELDSWFGDGLFGDDVVVWADGETVALPNQPLAVRGIVRNLQMLDCGVTAVWSRVSGPGTVSFADESALETTASFSQPGEYVLQLVVDDGVSPAGSTVTVAVDDGGPDTTPPAQLTGFVSKADESLVELDWYNSWEADVTGYNVYRRTASGSCGDPLVAGLTTSDYTDTQVTNGTAYYYVVTAVDSSGNESAPSTEVSALPELDLTAPAVPDDLYVASGHAYVLLNWADNTEEDLAGYNVYRRTASGSYGSALVSGLGVSEYIDNTVENGATYYYAVTAVDVHDNESAQSAEMSAVPEEFGGTTRIDFGTDPGRQTYTEAGFSFTTESIGSTVANLATAVQINSPSRNWTALSRTFDGLGTGLINDFTISMVLTVDAWNTDPYSQNERLFGIRLFGENPVNDTTAAAGICARLVSDRNGLDDLNLSDGFEGSTAVANMDTEFNGGEIERGATYTLTVNGTFDDSGNLTLDFTVDDGSHTQTLSHQFAPGDLHGDYFGIIGDCGGATVRVSSFSVVNIVPPALSPSGVYDFGTDPGKVTPEDAGFTIGPPSGTEVWSLEADSVRYAFGVPGTDEAHTASLLRPCNLDRSDGQSYTFEGVVDFTDGYGDDNNRIGILLFNATETQTTDGGGGLYLRLNTDGSGLEIADGINNANGTTVGLPSTSAAGAYNEDSWVGTRLKYAADIVFRGDLIDVTFTFTDQDGVEDTLNAQVYAANYPGTYFGFATKIRNRGDSVSNRNVPPVLDYKSFSFADNALKGYDFWATQWETDIGAGTNDSDADGINNLYEYGLDGNPVNPAVLGTLPTFTKAGNGFLYVHPKRSDDTSLIYTVETTTNLVDGTWTAQGHTTVGTNVTGGTLNFVTSKVDTAENKKFVRLRIEH